MSTTTTTTAPPTTTATPSSKPKVVSPHKLAHVVLRTSTSNYQPLIDFYTTFLGARIVNATPFISFLTYDDEHHRLAIMNVPDLAPKNRQTAGLEHIAFTFATVTDLVTAYKQRLEYGIKPVWCVNHGLTTSMYYKDIDGNLLETQFDNVSLEEAMKYAESEAFKENPIGVEFDPDELWERVQKEGEERVVESLRVKIDVGPRGVESVPMAYLE